MLDLFANTADSLGGSSRAPFAIQPDDGRPLPFVTKAIYVGGGGDVVVRGVSATDDVVYRNVPAGAYLTVRASHVRATGTTAAHLIGEA